MMKKKLIYAIALMVLPGLFLSCEKLEHNYIDGKSPDERSREYMENVRQTLIAAPHGWVAYVAAPSGLSFTYYMEFDGSNRVRMYGDFTDESMTDARESTFALRNTGIPSLIFDTYNYIHIPADPNNAHNGGVQGVGLSTDFEFSILDVSTDTLVMLGNLRSNGLLLVRATAEERAAVEAEGLLNRVHGIRDFFTNNLNNYVTLNAGGQERKVGINYSHSTRQLAYAVYEPDGTVSTGSTTFHYSVNGMEVWSDQLNYEGVEFTAARFRANGAMYLVDATGTEHDVHQNPNPLLPLGAMFGHGQPYPVMRIQGETLPANVQSEWNSVYQGMVSRFNGTGRTISFVEITLASENTGFVVIRYAAASAFSAIARFSYSVDDDHVMTITGWDSSAGVANSNWTTRGTQVGDFATWFQNQGPFKLDWVPGGDALLGGLFPVNNPANFLHGVLTEEPEIAVQQYL